MVAYHEIGHAMWRQRQGDLNTVHKIAIVPRTSRGAALGYTMQIDESDPLYLCHQKEEAFARLRPHWRQRPQKELVFNTVTWSRNDIRQATKIAWAMALAGMERTGMIALESETNPYLGETLH